MFSAAVATASTIAVDALLERSCAEVEMLIRLTNAIVGAVELTGRAAERAGVLPVLSVAVLKNGVGWLLSGVVLAVLTALVAALVMVLLELVKMTLDF